MTKDALWFLLPITVTLAGCGSTPEGTNTAPAAVENVPAPDTSLGPGSPSDAASPATSASATGAASAPSDAPAAPATSCTDPSIPRESAQPIAGSSAQAKLDAWHSQLDAYQTTVAAYNDAAAAQAAAYSAAATGVLGIPCTTDADCATGVPAFPGLCRVPYYGQAQCSVANANPVVGAPPAPPQPVLDCSDYTCPGDYQCEQEVSTGSVSCLAPRPKCPATSATAPTSDAGTGAERGGGRAHGGESGGGA